MIVLGRSSGSHSDASVAALWVVCYRMTDSVCDNYYGKADVSGQHLNEWTPAPTNYASICSIEIMDS